MSDHAPDVRVTVCFECGIEVAQAGGRWWHVSGGRRWAKLDDIDMEAFRSVWREEGGFPHSANVTDYLSDGVKGAVLAAIDGEAT